MSSPPPCPFQEQHCQQLFCSFFYLQMHICLHHFCFSDSSSVVLQRKAGGCSFPVPLLTRLPVLPQAHSPVFPHTNPLTHPSSTALTHSPACSPKDASAQSFLHPSNHPLTHPSIHLPPTKPPSSPSTHPFAHQLIHPPVSTYPITLFGMPTWCEVLGLVLRRQDEQDEVSLLEKLPV